MKSIAKVVKSFAKVRKQEEKHNIIPNRRRGKETSCFIIFIPIVVLFAPFWSLHEEAYQHVKKSTKHLKKKCWESHGRNMQSHVYKHKNYRLEETRGSDSNQSSELPVFVS